MKPQKPTNRLLEPHKAVESYLDNLLHDAVEPVVAEQPVKISPSVMFPPALESELEYAMEDIDDEAPLPDESLCVEVNQVHVPEPEIASLEKKTPELSSSVESEGVIEMTSTVDTDAIKHIEISQRYDFPMQCLMFRVSGNQLSIPLIDMGSVLPWGGSLTKLPYSPEWFLGLLIHRDQNVRVIDTAKFMHIPQTETKNEGRHILVFGRENWALTCDQLGDVVKLNENDVKWTKKGVQGLILGTIKSSLAILIDPNKFLLQLNQNS